MTLLGGRERVAEFLARSGVRVEIREFDSSTRSSALAAQALRCTVAEIAKSVVFVGAGPSVVVISGDKRVDSAALGEAVGGGVRVATADEVRSLTGYPIGGVPPFPHGAPVRVLADASLARFREVWAAGGAPNVVFRMETSDLMRLVGGEPCDVASG